jgi:hypothetical protein
MASKLIFTAQQKMEGGSYITREFISVEDFLTNYNSFSYTNYEAKLVIDLTRQTYSKKERSSLKDDDIHDFVKRAKIVKKLVDMELDKEFEEV